MENSKRHLAILETTMEVTYTSEDNFEVRLVYIVKPRYRNYPGIGKCWPKHTQCLMFINGLFVGHGEVVKHQLDEDNKRYAIVAATKKVMNKIHFTDIRKKLWEQIFEMTKGM